MNLKAMLLAVTRMEALLPAEMNAMAALTDGAMMKSRLTDDPSLQAK